MSQARRLRREPLVTRLMRRADLNAQMADGMDERRAQDIEVRQFMRDGELCREAAERMMKLEGYFDAVRCVVADAREDG